MNITNRLYTYPILCSDKDDYSQSTFDVNVNQTMSGVNNILLKFEFIMDNAELQNLIGSGLAEYVVHLECSNTTFRTTVRSSVKDLEYELPVSRVNGKLEMVAFIIAKNKINDFSSIDFNDDYEGLKFDLNKAAILGYVNLPALDITKDFEELSNASSIFLIYKRLTEESKPMDIDLDSSKIKVGLGTKEYDIYARFCSNIELQPILNAIIILPTLVFVFEELKQENGIDTYEDRDWFISLKLAYEKRGIDFINEINDELKYSITLAQEVMELPINSALSKISVLYENEEEG